MKGVREGNTYTAEEVADEDYQYASFGARVVRVEVFEGDGDAFGGEDG